MIGSSPERRTIFGTCAPRVPIRCRVPGGKARAADLPQRRRRWPRHRGKEGCLPSRAAVRAESTGAAFDASRAWTGAPQPAGILRQGHEGCAMPAPRRAAFPEEAQAPRLLIPAENNEAAVPEEKMKNGRARHLLSLPFDEASAVPAEERGASGMPGHTP